MEKSLWVILVPRKTNGGKPIRTRHHKVFDQKVLDMTGGLTIVGPSSVNGYWKAVGSGATYEESTIEVRIMCTEEQIIDIAGWAKRHYNQEAIMFYEISNNVRII